VQISIIVGHVVMFVVLNVIKIRNVIQSARIAAVVLLENWGLIQ
jgi:hypothetical protein